VRWLESWRADPGARAIADRHYNRQAIGSPQFVPPGRCVVLVIPDAALWISSWPYAEHVRHAWAGAWAGAWVCSAFRNERRDLYLSSELATEALAATRHRWTVPPFGMITFVDPDKTRRKRDPGRCFLRAGFHVSGSMPCCADKPDKTIGGLVALHIAPPEMPPACAPMRAQIEMAL